MRVGVTWQIAGVQRDPAPSHTLHVRHLHAFVDARGMMDFLFENCENSGRCRVTRPPRADTRSRDANTIAIYISYLLSGTGHDQQGSFGRTLGFPDILTRFQRHGFWGHSRALSKAFGKYREWPKDEQRNS